MSTVLVFDISHSYTQYTPLIVSITTIGTIINIMKYNFTLLCTLIYYQEEPAFNGEIQIFMATYIIPFKKTLFNG